MKLHTLVLVGLAMLGVLVQNTQARHRRHHSPRMSFGFSMGTPVVAAPAYYPVSYAQPCCGYSYAPVVYHTPVVRVRPHVGFSFGSGNVGFGFSI